MALGPVHFQVPILGKPIKFIKVDRPKPVIHSARVCTRAEVISIQQAPYAPEIQNKITIDKLIHKQLPA
jgi:hypothetical protein